MAALRTWRAMPGSRPDQTVGPEPSCEGWFRISDSPANSAFFLFEPLAVSLFRKWICFIDHDTDQTLFSICGQRCNMAERHGLLVVDYPVSGDKVIVLWGITEPLAPRLTLAIPHSTIRGRIMMGAREKARNRTVGSALNCVGNLLNFIF
jgi:hypothetical protein